MEADSLPTAASRRFVLPETVAIAAIGLADLLWTVYLVGTRRAFEANPLMAGVLRAWGPTAFVWVKAALLGIPLAVAECARSRSPRFVRDALRIALATYLLVYGVAWLRYNTPRLH